MKDNLFQKSFIKAKDYIKQLPKKTKSGIGIFLAVVLLAVVIVTALVNSKNGNYTVLYTGLSTSETGSIYSALSNMGADVKFDSNGNILVPKSEYDIWVLQLAAKGYPKTALTYDIFSSNSGMTATESEKAQWLIYQLQDRIQSTLERIDGVETATVTITIPETDNYVWETATTEQRASAGVLLSLDSEKEISGEQVSAICTLIASSVPKMDPADVTVVDAGTMLELSPESGSSDENGSDYNMGFELMVQKQIEDNVVRLLSSRYGKNGVVAVAKATIDYDKMMTEKLEMTPNTDGKGSVTHNEGSYSLEGQESAGDVVGTENNTDIPTYAYNGGTGNGMTDYSWSTDYDYSYIKTQIESGNAILKRATISVMVDENNLTETRVTELKSLVNGCTDIPTDLISVSAFDKAAIAGEDSPEPTKEPEDSENTSFLSNFLNLSTEAYIIIGAGFLVLLIAIIVLVVVIRNKRKKRMAEKVEAEKRAILDETRRKQAEIENYKKTLEDIAKGKVDPKSEAIVEEVREFTKTNPQIAANLIRTWLKEN
ncbi:MAG: flagellar basal-body MS-ring/collar protein FliF [Oscillospiraceae bacterium]|nr:flagellar basal-body MS-ring/collar protein FliF [Oscillospiraceae bacterium]